MSLTEIQQALQSQISGGELSFNAVGAQVPRLGVVTEELPPLSAFPIAGAQLELVGAGASQTLTIAGTVDWQLLTPTAVSIVVSVDPTDATGYLTKVQFAAPSSAKLSIPGVPWFALGDFKIQGANQPAVPRTELLPQALLSIGTTVLIQGDSSQTPIPITIGNDPTGTLRLELNTSAIALPSINDVLAAFGSQSGSFSLPASIDDLLSFSIEDLLVCFDPAGPSVSQIGVQIGNQAAGGAGWPIIPGFFTLDGYALALNIVDPLGTAQIGGMVSATGKLGSVDVGVAALHPASGGWSFNGYLGKDDGIPIGELVGGLAKQFGVSLPAVLTSFTLNDFELGFDSLTYDTHGRFSLDFDVNGTAVDLTASAALTYQNGAYTPQVDGKLTVGRSVFEVSFGMSPSTFAAGWSDEASPLELADIAKCFGFGDVPEIPPALDLRLVEAKLSYDFASGALVLAARSKTYGNAVFAAVGGGFFFGLSIDRRIGLSDLPIIGPKLDPAASVGIDGIQLLVSSTLDPTTAARIDAELAKLGPGYPLVPKAGMSGVALAMAFDAGGDKTLLTLAAPPSGSGGGASTAPVAGGEPVPLGAAPGPPPSPSDGTVWLTVQKSFGPVAFQKVGVRYRDSVLYFLMNASVSAGGLTIAAIGLGAGSPLSTFEPKFTIDGLAVTYAEGPLELSGALVGSIDPVNFYGELVVGVEELQIAALGGYCEVDGHPSFFLYAVLDYPIGGPSFFFVTGLAAGFGFNRKLAIPPVDGVATFPFVQWAQGAGNPPPMDTGSIADTVTKAIGELSRAGVVAPSVGDDWFAVGVRFTSFELVDSFALLTVELGTEFEVALVGLSTVQIPPAPAPPVALAQLELEAALVPSEGRLSISGQLTPQSFVLSRDCHLTGGFALETWFSGDHEGEFVVTLGGYSPRFDPPSYYPKVPRLGLDWQVSSELAVKGDLYFALTSSAVMAGGGLSAVWQSGDIRAWFDVEADFLLVFEPFHYYVSLGIHLGASFTVNLLFTSFKVSIHLGVAIEIWGPEFAGKATIDLSIISFTISFGGGSPDASTTIGWGDFVAKLIPSQPAKALPGAALGDDPPAPAVVQIVVQDGLVKRLSDDDGALNWVVNGQQLKLVTQSAIPTKDWTFGASVTLAPDQPAANTEFGVGPAGVANAAFESTHAIEVSSTEDCAFLAAPVLRNVPAALWQVRRFDSHGVPVGVDPLTSTTVDGVAVGFTLTPVVTPPDHTLPIPIENLEYTIADPIEPFAWTDAIAPETDPFDGQTVWGTIAAPGPTAVRTQLVEAVAGEGWSVPTTLDVTELSSQATYDLIADPVLRLLGEQR